MHVMAEVEIVEVGPRDGLQNIATFVPNAAKIELIRRLVDAGFTRLELGSFVSPKAIPQMTGIEQVVAGVTPLPDGVTGMALVPNTTGARRAIEAGVTSLIFVISMSEAHNRSNVRRSIDDSIADLKSLLDEVDSAGRLKLRVGLATCFHCPFDGLMDDRQVLSTLERIVALRDGMDFAVSDTTGMATPDHVRRLSAECLRAFGGNGTFGFHGHDTAGFGIANILAAMDAGIRSFDTSVAGLGGCPFAPGATGNVASEDVVYLFQRLGVETGIDLGKLLDAGTMILEATGVPHTSHARAISRDRLFAELTGRRPAEAVAG
jgi:hydroxymethylglutaryl-CoA lyase